MAAITLTKLAVTLATDKRFWKFIGGVLLVIVLVVASIFSTGTGHNVKLYASDTLAKEMAPYFQEANSILEGEPIHTPVLYAAYLTLFENKKQHDKNDVYPRLAACAYTITEVTETVTDEEGNETEITWKIARAITDDKQILDNIASAFGLHISEKDRAYILDLSRYLAPGSAYTDQDLLANLDNDGSKTNIGLANFCWNALDTGSGYLWGAYGQRLTLDFLYQKQEVNKGSLGWLTDSEMQRVWHTYGGRNVFDCVGLIKAYGWLDTSTGDIKYNPSAMPDVGANGMYQAAKTKGKFDPETMPDIPGIALHHPGHIGVYVGNGMVIEARGKDEGVMISPLYGDQASNQWDEWLYVPGITYLTEGTYNIHGEQIVLGNQTKK